MMGRIGRHTGVLFGFCAVTFILALIASGMFVGGVLPSSDASAPTTQDWGVADHDYWKVRVEKVGGVKAFSELADTIATEDPLFQHSKAHGFGGLLYETEGLSGFAACDMRFSMGCFHEFLGKAIASEGKKVVSQLVAECDKLPTDVSKSGCRHGVGHGIQAWLGYDPKNLLEGLVICKSAMSVFGDPFGGCSSGLYMEYNLRIMLGIEAPFRQVDNDNYLAPCDIVPKDALPICIFWLPQWWASLLHSKHAFGEGDPQSNYLADYKEVGRLCRSLNLSRELEDSCFQGVGATVSGAGDSLEYVIEACTGASENMREQVLCRGFIAAVYASEKKPNTDKICEGFTGSAFEYCNTYATGKADFLNMISVPKGL